MLDAPAAGLGAGWGVTSSVRGSAATASRAPMAASPS
jgi:hypothetical protein